MKSLSFITDTPTETQRLAGRLARRLVPGDVVLFVADLGAGKTTFVQGAARALGAKNAALSPTFVVAETIDAKVPIHHIDFYRLTREEILGMGVQDYLTGTGEIAPGIVFIEWADRFRRIWPKERLEVRIAIERGGRRRRIRMTARGRRFAKVLAQLRKKS
jgi:tRNA threonylcarbamoyladenosine biosynthesis protein TsaE